MSRSGPQSPPALSDFLARAREAWDNSTWVRLHLGSPRPGIGELRQLRIRPIQLRGEPLLQFTYRHATRDITRNLPVDEGLTQITELLGTDFTSAFLSTTRWTAQLQLQTGRSQRLVMGPPETTTAPDPSHDRPRQHPVPAQAPWLQALGLTDAQGRVRSGREAKYRQVQRFTELLEHLIREGERPNHPLALVDMGCGRGYLTFAAHQLLLQRWGPDIQSVGIEQRPDLVRSSQEIAQELGWSGLSFQQGTIQSAPATPCDLLVALHACDTATDDALAHGIRVGARWLMVTPCCHKEVRPQMEPPDFLQGPWRHGILREREAEWVTDALRAELLEAMGYSSKVLEFISPEHTSKNLMITGVLGPTPPESRSAARDRAGALAAHFHLRHQQLALHLGIRWNPLPGAGTPTFAEDPEASRSQPLPE